MRRAYKHLVLVALVSLFVGLGIPASYQESSPAQTAAPKPNIIFILTDDMRKDDLTDTYMPKTTTALVAKGMSFENAFVSNPICCPSRATIMRGQYAHNTDVWFNNNVFDPDPNVRDGGWKGYNGNGYEDDNVATHLKAAGYTTGLFGKYQNGYSGTTKPPGWDDWFAMLSGRGYVTYYVNDNGTKKSFDSRAADRNGTKRFFGSHAGDYSTYVFGRKTRSFIDASVAAGKPFFAYVAPKAPHEPATPALRHAKAFDGEKAPRLPSFNESDVSDKPPSIRSLPPLSRTEIAQIDALHEKRVESLQAVDDLVEGVVNKLQAVGVLDNTYVVFTSDNGWYHGEHRIKAGKEPPYEESIRMPLLVRGPGVQAGTTTDKLTLNTDFFPTFTDLAGVTTPEYVDGRSLRSVLEGNATTWRTAFLLERRDVQNSSASFYGIRTSDGRKYIEYEGGFKELYNLKADPYEQNNSYAANSSSADLARRLQVLKGCAGATCRAVEDGGP